MRLWYSLATDWTEFSPILKQVKQVILLIDGEVSASSVLDLHSVVPSVHRK